MNRIELLKEIENALNYRQCRSEEVEEIKQAFKELKQDLERLEKIEKDLKQTKSNFKNSQTHSKNCYKKILDRYMGLEKENAKLKNAIEILKDKNVNIFYFFDFISLDAYNDQVSNDFGVNDYNLTQEEYELLKEVLGNGTK